MYDFKISEEVTQKVLSDTKGGEKRKKVNEMLDKLNSVASTFAVGNDEPAGVDKVELNKKTFEAKGEQEVYDQAYNELRSEKDSAESGLHLSANAKKQELLDNRQSVKENSDLQKQSLQGYYDSAKESASNEALRRGIARSSIVINQLDAFDSKQIEDFKAIDEQLTKKVDALNFELSGLNTQLQNALNDLNIAHAVKIKDRVNKINTQLKEEENKIIEYNNDIALKEAQFNKDVEKLRAELASDSWDKNTDIADLYGKYGFNIVNRIVQDNLHDVAKEYLSGFTNEEVLMLLQEEEVKAALGPAYDAIAKEYGLK